MYMVYMIQDGKMTELGGESTQIKAEEFADKCMEDSPANECRAFLIYAPNGALVSAGQCDPETINYCNSTAGIGHNL